MKHLNYLRKTFINDANGQIIFELDMACPWFYYEDDDGIKCSEKDSAEEHEHLLGKKWVLNSFPLPLTLLNELTGLEDRLNPILDEEEGPAESWPSPVSPDEANKIIEEAFETLKEHATTLNLFSYPALEGNVLFSNDSEEFRDGFRANLPVANQLCFKGYDTFDFHQKRISLTYFLYEVWGPIFLEIFRCDETTSEEHFLKKLSNFDNGADYFDKFQDTSKLKFIIVKIESGSEAFIIADQNNEWIGFGFCIPPESMEEYKKMQEG